MGIVYTCLYHPLMVNLGFLIFIYLLVLPLSSKAGWIRFTVQLKADLSLTRVKVDLALQKTGHCFLNMISLKHGVSMGH